MYYPVFEETIHNDFDGINDIDIEIEENQIEIPELYESSYSDSPTPPPIEYFHAATKNASHSTASNT